VLLVAGLVVSVLSLGKIVKNRANVLGPQIAKVDVTLDNASVWIFPGRAQLTGLTIGNPPTCKSKVAVKIGDISVRLNPLTALSEKMIIDSVIVKSPEITLEGGLKKNNLTQIQQNVEDYLNGGAAPAADQPSAPAGASKPSMKFQVNELVISGAKLHVISLFKTGANISMPLPEIRMANLGAGEGGLTSPEIIHKALAAVLNSIAENAADTVSNLGKDAVSKAKKFDFKKAGEKLKGIFGQ
jgi:uncharacterized protein involved in outer membrane biogenesis